MLDIIIRLQNYHAAELLLIAAAILILVDYYFLTDWPAHVGYTCIAASVFFFVLNLSPGATWQLVPSLLLGIAVDKGLAILHQVLFRRFLTNAPATSSHDEELGDILDR